MMGEAIEKEIKQLIIDPASGALDEIRKTASQVASGPKAEQELKDFLRGRLDSPQAKFFAGRAAVKGLKAAQDFSNVTQAERGSVADLQEHLGAILRRGDLQQKGVDLITRLRGLRASGDELKRLQIEIAKGAERDLFFGPGPYPLAGGGAVNQAFAEWARAHGEVEPQTFAGALAGKPAYKAGAYERYRQATMDEEERAELDALREFVRSTQGNLGRAGQPSAVELPSLGGGTAPAAPGVVAPPSDRSGTGPEGSQPTRPAPMDSSSLPELFRRLEQQSTALERQSVTIDRLADTLANLQMNVTVEDTTGQQIARRTSRPSSLEQLHDE